MIQQVENLMRVLTSLPEPQQAALAEAFLEELKWELSLTTDQSSSFLDMLIDETKQDEADGTGMPMDEFFKKADELNQLVPNML